ncbi:hypothetical protein HRW08_06975 [Streptomyces lunaelactis]|nr:hypothetical protein [Streptomyces lunaelactis]
MTTTRRPGSATASRIFCADGLTGVLLSETGDVMHSDNDDYIACTKQLR